PGFDSYLSPRLFARSAWYFVKRWLGIDSALGRGEALDREIERINEIHWSNIPGVDRLVLLAFDEYYDASGRAVGMAEKSQRFGSDLYTSNSLVRAMCATRPDRFVFCGSLHPYRRMNGRDACDMLEELAAGGVRMIKWLPIH